jgi:carbonic anhydrase/acetyltransferase-like protein (isoleucine patch superfamily)
MSGLIIPLRGHMPYVAPDAYVAPNATLVGDVSIGPGAT